ncbi:MAG: efflux RND transporter periplasmic adaptor subunit [Betaproteobacteria bacterium]|nr:efflux RND transporter periplasmic adaptor subunit [Betaproteobacteria bacterium]
MKRLVLIAGLVLGALAVAVAVRGQEKQNGQAARSPSAPSAPASTPAPVSPAAKQAPAQAMQESEIAALIAAGEETVLSAQMAGRIKDVNIGLGDQFKRGARLLEFDCSEQQAQLDTADAEYRAARETHLARLRLQALGAAGELEVSVAAAAADKAKSQLALRESQLAYCKVDAPFSGNVARIRVKAAESVQVGQPLLDLVNPASLKAQMFVPAAWVAWLRVGMPLTIQVRETGQSFRARVSKMNSRVDGVSQQLELEARIEKGNGRLLPGMVGIAQFDNRPAGK